MGSVFRPTTGLVYALYVDGVRCAFESMAISFGVGGSPTVMVRVPATKGIIEVIEYDDDTKARIAELEEQKQQLYFKLQSMIGINTTEMPTEKQVEQTTAKFKMNAAGIRILQEEETFAATSYKDPSGYGRNIGYGHQIKPGEPYEGMKISKEQAVEILKKDLIRFENHVRKVVKVPLTSNQFSALVDFCYTTGEGLFAEKIPGGQNTLVVKLNKGDYTGAAAEFSKWVYGGRDKLGQKIKLGGLVRRRAREQELFLTPDNSEFTPTKKDYTAEERKEIESTFNEINKQIDAVDSKISNTKKTAKKVVVKKGFDWRSIRPNTKVHVLFKDTNWDDGLRFVGYFEGDITSLGAHNSAESTDFQFVVNHISDNLETLELMVLDPGEFINDEITGTAQKEGLAVQATIKGSILERFSPTEIEQFSGVSKRHLDMYNYCIFGLQLFHKTIKESTVADAYASRAVSVYDLANRIYNPNKDPETGEAKDTKSKLQWSEMYNLIMTYTLMGLLPQIGSRLSFMQVMKTVAQMFLHEVMVLPNPTREDTTIMVKPTNVFGPIPMSNIIYPLHGADYDHSELWKTKPTRLIQNSQPPNGLQAGNLARYFTNIAPRSLSEKFDRYNTLSEEEKKTFQLLTDEETERTIVSSYNDLPAFVTAALQVITSPDLKNEQIGSDIEVVGAGKGYAKMESTSTTLKTGDEAALSPEGAKAAHAKLYIHKRLLILEGLASDTKIISKQVLKTSSPPFTSAYKFVPNRITIIPKSYKLSTGNNGKAKWTYDITNGVVNRNIGRYYQLFEEPTAVIHYMLHIDKDKAELRPENKQTSFAIGGNKNTERTLMPLDYDKANKGTPLAHIKEISNFVTGGFHQSVIIYTDLHEASLKKVAELCAYISEMCGINTKQNIRFLSDYYDPYMENNSTKTKDDIIRKAIEPQIGTYKDALLRDFNAELKANEPTLANTKAGTSSASGEPVLISPSGDSASGADVSKGVEEKVEQDKELILSKDKEVLLKNVYDNYIQPLCEYYFYYNRYVNNSQSLSIAHNPYIIPGQPGLVLDKSDIGMHLINYITQVTQQISSSGSLFTTVSTSFVRRGDDQGMALDLKLTAPKVVNTSGELKYAETVAESLKDRIPFFGGEYSEENVDATFDKTLGVGRLKSGNITEEEIHQTDYISMTKTLRRKMQYCKITDVPDPEEQARLDKLFKDNPSRITFKWNNGDFPEQISIIKAPVLSAVNVKTSEEMQKNYVIDIKLFNPVIQEFIRHHSELCLNTQAQKG